MLRINKLHCGKQFIARLTPCLTTSAAARLVDVHLLFLGRPGPIAFRVAAFVGEPSADRGMEGFDSTGPSIASFGGQMLEDGDGGRFLAVMKFHLVSPRRFQ